MPGCGSTGVTRRCPPTVYSYGATSACYTLDQVAQAEARLPAAPVNPSRAIRRVANLRLTTIVVWQADTHPSDVIGIDYVFGTIPASGLGAILPPSVPRPTFALVSEAFGPRPSGRWRVTRTVGHFPSGKPAYGSWGFYSGNLSVQGDLTRRETRQVGLKILAQG